MTPFSERARDRALKGVLASFVRQDIPDMALPGKAAANFDKTSDRVNEIVKFLSDRAYSATNSEQVASDTTLFLDNLASEWSNWASAGDKLVYAPINLPRNLGGADAPIALMRPMERTSGPGEWPVATSLREVEEEVDVVLLQDEGA